MRGFNAFIAARSEWHDGSAVGDVTNALTTEARSALTALILPLELVSTGLLLCLYLMLLVGLSPSLTATALAALLVLALPLRIVMYRSLAAGRKMSQANRDMATFLAQRLQSPRLIRLSGAEAAESQSIEQFTGMQRTMAIAVGRLQALADVIVEPFVAAVAFVLIYFGFTYYEMPLGTIAIFMAILLRLLPIMKTLVATRQAVVANLGALETVERRLREMENAAEPRAVGEDFPGPNENIEFRNVTYAYSGTGRAALRGISMRIPAHRVTGVVGPSGSGKSTLTDLLPRLRDPQAGQIVVDGVPLTDFDRTSLRRSIAYVSQRPQLFNVTAADHIRYGKPGASDDEVRWAASLAGAASFITELPEGYDSLLGENAARLSGGQRQRLDLARALIRRAPILILDEPTSNLDADSELLFRDTLAQIREAMGMTVIIIAHRLSTVTQADQIIVLIAGQVEDSGTHAELLRRPNWYSQAYRQQMQDSAAIPPAFSGAAQAL
jgi:ABC-type multidrug transport system fused ATPase/permease subunit